MTYGQKPWLNFYDPRVADDISIPYTSLFDLLKRAAEEYGDKHAFTFNSRSWSYNQARTIAEWFAASLYRNGFKKGDRLSHMVPYSPPYIFSLFAGFRLGGILVQLNPMYAETEIEFVLNDSGAGYMVVQEEFYQRVKKVQERTSLRKIIVVSSGKRQLELDAADHYFDDFPKTLKEENGHGSQKREKDRFTR